jgi:plasmid stability protein
MPLLQVRDCPEDVYQKLRFQAERDNRSVPQEAVVLLRDALQIRDARHSINCQKVWFFT